MKTIYYIEAILNGVKQYQIYDKLLTGIYTSILADLRVYATESGAQKALQALNADYGFTNGEAYIVAKELPAGFMYKNNRLKTCK